MTTFDDAVRYLYAHVPRGRTLRYPGQLGIDRARALLAALGGPQNHYRVIHLAGTSGKGSTATFISSLLRAHGFSVGLHLSPHLLDIRERVQLNGQLIDRAVFAQHAERVFEAAASLPSYAENQPTYFELLVAIAFLAFAESGVDYAVIETGLGGTYDGTNVVDRPDKVCVMTPIDVDHARILGATPPENAIQKAGIIQKGNLVVVGPQADEVLEVIHERCSELGVVPHVVTPVSSVVTTSSGTTCAWNGYQNLELGLAGTMQAANAALALSATRLVADRDKWSLDERAVRTGLRNAQLRGRFEVHTIGKRTVIFDGAHNPQKMASLADALRSSGLGARYDFLVSFREGKDVSTMLAIVGGIAGSIVGTTFEGMQDSAIKSVSLAELSMAFHALHLPTSLADDPAVALEALVRTDGPPVVVTGSLYLLSTLLPAVDTGLGKK